MPRLSFNLRTFILLPMVLSATFILLQTSRRYHQDHAIVCIVLAGGKIRIDETRNQTWDAVLWNQNVIGIELDVELLDDPTIVAAIDSLPSIESIRLLTDCSAGELSKLAKRFPRSSVSIDKRSAIKKKLTEMFGDKVEFFDDE